jgi:hypothetical protein
MCRDVLFEELRVLWAVLDDEVVFGVFEDIAGHSPVAPGWQSGDFSFFLEEPFFFQHEAQLLYAHVVFVFDALHVLQVDLF